MAHALTDVRTPGGAPLVSVVTTFLNAQRYLAEAIDSVLAQTWPHYELVLVDDGSTDASTEIARTYAQRNPGRVRVVEHAGHANLGMSASRNAGAAAANGVYLAFLDADDVYRPEKLKRQVAVLEARPDVDAVFGETLWWYSWTGEPADAGRDAVRRLHLDAGATFEPGELVPRLVRCRIRTPATCSVLVRRAAYARIGGFEPGFRTMYEDQAFFFKLFLHCRTHMADGVLDWYRQHPDSCCSVAARAGEYREDGGPSPSRKRFLDWAAHYLRNQERSSIRLRSLVAVQRYIEGHPRFLGSAARASVREPA